MTHLTPSNNANTPQEFEGQIDLDQDLLEPFDVRESSGRQGLFKLFVIGALLLIAALVVLKLYSPGVRDRSDPPHITAENTPFKVVPEDTGGVETPDQDRVVFEVMDGQTPARVVTPAPTPEAPMTLDLPEIVEPAPITPTLTPPSIPKPVPMPVIPPSPPAPVIQSPSPKPTTAVATGPALGNSNYVVQIASLRTDGEARAHWSRMEKRFPELLSRTFGDIKRVDLNAKGIYYRVRAAGLADEAAAKHLCRSLKSAGQSCFVTRR